MSEIQKNLKIEHVLIIATIGLAPFLGNLDGSIVMIASPILEKVFHTDTSGVSMVMVVYLLISASFALIFGRLGDMIGSTKIFITGFAVLTIGSTLCGISPGLNYLVAFRIIQALGSTMLFSTYYAVVATSLPDEIKGRAFGFISVLGSIGFAVGAPIGGLILKYLSWHWLFLFNIPFGIAGFILSYKFLHGKQIPPQEKNVPFDIPGGFLSLICLMAFVYALNIGQDIGWSAPLTIASFVISLVCLFLFIIREKAFSTPLVDITIFKNLYLSLAVIAALIVIILLDGTLFLFPYFLELVKGFSTEKAGLVLMALPVAFFIFSPLAGYLSDKKSPQLIASVSTVFILITCIIFTLLKADTPVLLILLPFLLFGVSFAFFTISNVTLVMSQATPGKQGIISATLAVINSVGALMGVSFFQIIFSGNIGTNIKELHNVPDGMLMQGFHTAMIFAVILCIPALIASIIIRDKKS